MEDDSRKTDANAAGTVSRVVSVIRCLAEAEDDLSIKELSEKLNLSGSTVHRLLQLLRKEAIVEGDPLKRRYRGGPELHRISSLVASKNSLKDLALPLMKAVVDECGEACMLVEYLPSSFQVWITAAVNSANPLRYQIDLFEAHSVAWGATGRSILAFLPRDEQMNVYRHGDLSPATGASLPDQTGFFDEMDKLRRQGYAVSFGQKIKGAVGLGAPVFNRTGRVIGSLCITLPEVRYSPMLDKQLATLLRTQAQKLSGMLGFSGPYPGL